LWAGLADLPDPWPSATEWEGDSMRKQTRRISTIAGVLAASAAAAWAAEPTAQDLRIQKLEAEVAELRASQASNSKDLAQTVDAVLRDAERRSQLLATSGDMGAGYDNGFFIKSGDSFYLHPFLQFQPRYTYNFRENGKSTGNNDSENGFELRRMKLGFDGYLFTPDLTYAFIWATDRNSGNLVLEEAWAKYMFSDQLGVFGGQFKDPFAHEGMMSSKKLLAAEHSYVDDVLGGGDNFVQGAGAVLQDGKNGSIRATLAFTDGIGSANTNFTDGSYDSKGNPTGSTRANFGVAGRVEYKVMGDWKAYDDFTALGTKNDLLVFSAGVDWTENGDADALLHTVDAQYENAAGLALYGAFLGRYTAAGNSSSNDTYDWGALAQAAYLFNQNWEVFGRYDYTYFDSVGSDGNPVHEITVGLNYYFHGHAAKVTVDATYLPDGAYKADTSGDILGGKDNQCLVRAQLQLLI
jgi:hypothetical protein